MSDFFYGLQSILGTDKKNPMFAVYRDAAKRELHVYYGFELLEVVPDDKTSPLFKLMVAQLYNAGVKGVTLVEVFSVDPKYMRKWGRALKSGDPETLVNALQGRGARKLTPEIKAFIRRRFPILYTENPRNYSSRMRQEILDIFSVKLSGEGLRAFFHELKAQLHSKPAPKDPDNPRQFLASSEDLKNNPPPGPPPPPGPAPSEPNDQNASHGTGKAEETPAKKGALAV